MGVKCLWKGGTNHERLRNIDLMSPTFCPTNQHSLPTRVPRGAGWPARVLAFAGRVRKPAELRVRVEFGAGRARDKKLFVRVTECLLNACEIDMCKNNNATQSMWYNGVEHGYVNCNALTGPKNMPLPSWGLHVEWHTFILANQNLAWRYWEHLNPNCNSNECMVLLITPERWCHRQI